jgi:hypothetical protein
LAPAREALERPQRTEFDKLTYAALVMEQWDHLPNEEGFRLNQNLRIGGGTMGVSSPSIIRP